MDYEKIHKDIISEVVNVLSNAGRYVLSRDIALRRDLSSYKLRVEGSADYYRGVTSYYRVIIDLKYNSIGISSLDEHLACNSTIELFIGNPNFLEEIDEWNKVLGSSRQRPTSI